MTSDQAPVDGATRTETVVAAHSCAWSVDDGGAPQQGQCGCGLRVQSEDEWRHHTERAVIDELGSPTAELVTSAAGLDELPDRSVIVVHPGGENAVFRRIDLGDLGAWCNLSGTFRFTPAGLLPAVILERGPVAPTARAARRAAATNQTSSTAKDLAL
ncbi:hypothetical protein [Mycobacterium sp. SMC-17]|uniref:hypothetical protein n=1 Tax=Mycobacterium sp. SMC-17 TaxID=3381628 RepID=UPI003876AEEB